MNTGAAVIVFREVLEAALVISIVTAATRGVLGRARWLGLGVAGGVLGSILVALGAESISQTLEGMGQEVFNASVLMAAVLMLAWHNIWMAKHGRELAKNLSRVGLDVAAGAQPLYAIALVVGLALLREGSEIVLFLSGMAAGKGDTLGLVSGSAVGLGAGALVGWLLYRGLLRIPMRYFFQVTGWMILLLAGGMAATAAGFLEQAGYLPSLVDEVWDSSAILSINSTFGQLLHTLLGYQDRPTGMQLLWQLTTMTVILICQTLVARKDRKSKQPARSVTTSGSASHTTS